MLSCPILQLDEDMAIRSDLKKKSHSIIRESIKSLISLILRLEIASNAARQFQVRMFVRNQSSSKAT